VTRFAMNTSNLFRSLRWMMLAAALNTATAIPEMGPSDGPETADFIAMDLKADRKLVGCKVDVAVENSIATLTGTALSLQQAERAVARAKATDGVRAVVNRVKIMDPVAKDAVLAERVEQRLVQSPAIDATRVKVSVDHRRVLLAGEIGSWDEQELAREIATEIPGIIEVENRLEVTFDTVRSDDAIREQIRYIVADDPLFAGVNVDVMVEDGVVSLGGEVGSPGEKAQLIHTAHVTGVTEVWGDDIMINSDLAMEGLKGKVPSQHDTLKALNSALASDPRLKRADIRGEMSERVMKLTGTAPSREARAAAESTARGLPGVSIVSNEIRVVEGGGTAQAGKDRPLAAVTP
jgi:osmotically-inducible protein OsmY